MPSIPANCKLLLHCDGTDGSTSFPDSSGTSKSVTAVGTAQVDTAYYKFATGSCLLDGNSDYLSVPDSADWAFGTGDFALGFWVRFNTVKTTGFFGQDQTNTLGWDMYYASGSVTFLIDGSPAVAFSGWTPSANTWYHIELNRNGNNWYFFVNGTQTGSTQVSSGSVADRASVLRIGCTWYDSAINIPLDGWMDEIIVVKGSYLHIANFTPPVVPYGTADPTFKNVIVTVI